MKKRTILLTVLFSVVAILCVTYILVTDKEDGDSEALILKDVSNSDDEEALYEIVSDDEELNAVADIFDSLIEDISFV